MKLNWLQRLLGFGKIYKTIETYFASYSETHKELWSRSVDQSNRINDNRRSVIELEKALKQAEHRIADIEAGIDMRIIRAAMPSPNRKTQGLSFLEACRARKQGSQVRRKRSDGTYSCDIMDLDLGWFSEDISAQNWEIVE